MRYAAMVSATFIRHGLQGVRWQALLLAILAGCSRDPRPGRIALVQYDASPHFADSATNTANLMKWATEAVSRGANVMVFPEGSIHGYRRVVDGETTEAWASLTSIVPHRIKRRDIAEAAEPVPGGPSTRRWGDFARSHKVYVVLSLPESEPVTGRYYDTLVVVGPAGYVTRYRKRDLAQVDRYYAQPGMEPSPVVKTPWGAFGLLICLDAMDNLDERWKELLALGVNGAIVVADWGWSPHQLLSAQRVMSARASRYGIDIFFADASPWDGTARYRAGTGAVERNGLPMPAAGVDGISLHDVDYRRAASAR